MTNSNTLTESAANAASDTAAKLSSTAQSAIDKLDASRGAVAAGIEKTAGVVRSLAPESAVRQARNTADAMENAAGYLRSRDVRTIGADLTETVRRNPTPSLIAAVAIGFLLGRTLRRS